MSTRNSEVDEYWPYAVLESKSYDLPFSVLPRNIKTFSAAPTEFVFI